MTEENACFLGHSSEYLEQIFMFRRKKGELNLQIKLGTASRAALPPLNVVHGEAGTCQSPPLVNPTLSRANTELRNNQ